MRSKFLLIAVALIAGSASVHAQKTITFESSNYSSHSRSRRDANNAKNSLTIGVISWLNGYVPVHYERAVTKFLSVQVGAGITFHSYGNDFGELFYDEGQKDVLFNNSDGYTDIGDNYYNYKHRKSKLGYYLSFSPRIYFRDNIMNGFTLAPLLEYKRFNYSAQMADITPGTYPETDEDAVPHSGSYMKEHTNCLDVMLSVGGHYQGGSHLAMAWCIGFGIRNMSASRLDLGYYTDPIAAQQYYVNRERDFKTVRPLVTFDYRIGGWF